MFDYPGHMSPDRAATILHADLDAFYASVEQLLDPSLRGRPIAVGGSVVLAASYDARARGVQAGMAGWKARQLCPDLQFVGGHFDEYQRLGDQVIDVLGDFTPLVERVSIDEAFCDVAGALHLFGPPRDIGIAIRERVQREIGLPLSIGVARTKHLAKIASQVAKPDGLVVVEPDAERGFLEPLPVGLIWGVGPSSRERLAAAGIRTIGDLAEAPDAFMERLFGRAVGHKLVSLAANDDPRKVERRGKTASVGAQAALGRTRATPELLRSTFGHLADRVAGRLRAASRAGRTVTVRVRFPDFHSVTRSVTLPLGITSTLSLTELATELTQGALADHRDEPEVTLLAISVGNLTQAHALQLELPLGLDDEHRPGTAAGSARWRVDRAFDEVRDRFGRHSIGYATVVFSDAERVPDAFRELAERHL